MPVISIYLGKHVVIHTRKPPTICIRTYTCFNQDELTTSCLMDYSDTRTRPKARWWILVKTYPSVVPDFTCLKYSGKSRYVPGGGGGGDDSDGCGGGDDCDGGAISTGAFKKL